MIKKQYDRFKKGYFFNFINSSEPDADIEDALRLYKATLGKSKAPNYKLNVKWHNERLYMMFVLKWS